VPISLVFKSAGIATLAVKTVVSIKLLRLPLRQALAKALWQVLSSVPCSSSSLLLACSCCTVEGLLPQRKRTKPYPESRRSLLRLRLSLIVQTLLKSRLHLRKLAMFAYIP
jgi:hypothetical protein